MNPSGPPSNLTMEAPTNETNWLFNTTGSDATFSGGRRTSGILLMKITLPLCLLYAVRIALGCMSATVNYFLFCGLAGVSSWQLKAKALLQVSAIANTILPFASGINLRIIVEAFWEVSDNMALCFAATTANVFGLAVFVQSICGLGLACDRFYAVSRPLQYHTSGYKKGVKRLMVISPVLLPLLIYIAFVVFALRLPVPFPDGFSPVCVILQRAQLLQLASNVVENVLLFCVCTSFLLYNICFLVFRVQRMKLNWTFGPHLNQENVRLTAAYLMTNIFTLLLYSPAPVFSYTYGKTAGQPGSPEYEHFFLIRNALVTVYMINSVLAPVILAHRIPSIRKSLPFDLEICGDLQTSHSSTAATSSKTI